MSTVKSILWWPLGLCMLFMQCVVLPFLPAIMVVGYYLLPWVLTP